MAALSIISNLKATRINHLGVSEKVTIITYSTPQIPPRSVTIPGEFPVASIILAYLKADYNGISLAPPTIMNI